MRVLDVSLPCPASSMLSFFSTIIMLSERNITMSASPRSPLRTHSIYPVDLFGPLTKSAVTKKCLHSRFWTTASVTIVGGLVGWALPNFTGSQRFPNQLKPAPPALAGAAQGAEGIDVLSGRSISFPREHPGGTGLGLGSR
jgi:hypothetical protein